MFRRALKLDANYINIRHLLVTTMADVAERILTLFNEQPQLERSTSELIKDIYPEDYQRLKRALHDPYTTKETRTVAKRRKAQLHRRLLYHLNQLVDDGTLMVTQRKGKGEKCYCLARPNHRHQVAPHTPKAPSRPLHRLERYQQQGILTGYDTQGWHSRLNAVLLDIRDDDDAVSLQTRIATVMRSVNDVIGLHGVEKLLMGEDLQSLTNMLKQLDIDTRDSNKQVSLHFDLTAIPVSGYVEDFFEAYSLLAPPNVNVVLGVTAKTLDRHQHLMKGLVRWFAQATLKINLHNKDVHEAPIIIGTAGVYTLQDEEWQTYLDELQGKTIGLCLCQTSAGVDVHRFLREHHNPKEFREFILKIAREMVESNTQQRKRADMYCADLNNLQDEPHAFFRFSNNLIRLWNYDWEGSEYEYFVDLLRTTSEQLAEFCRTEETIFKSCGLPIRFNTSMASMFSKFQPGFFSKRRYRKLTVTGLRVLKSEGMRRFIEARERIASLVNNHDRLRLFRATPAEPSEVSEEMRHVLKEDSLPHVTFDFAERRDNLTLDRFFGGEDDGD